MKEGIGDRINELLAHFSMSKAELSRRMGLKNAVTISRITGDHVKPSYEILLRILEIFPETNANWLLIGEGEMFSQKVNSTNPADLKSDQKWFIDILKKELEDKRKDCADLRKEIEALKYELAMLTSELKKKETIP